MLTKDNFKVSKILMKSFLTRDVQTLYISQIRTKILVKVIAASAYISLSISSFGTNGAILGFVATVWTWVYIG